MTRKTKLYVKESFYKKFSFLLIYMNLIFKVEKSSYYYYTVKSFNVCLCNYGILSSKAMLINIHFQVLITIEIFRTALLPALIFRSMFDSVIEDP